MMLLAEKIYAHTLLEALNRSKEALSTLEEKKTIREKKLRNKKIYKTITPLK